MVSLCFEWIHFVQNQSWADKKGKKVLKAFRRIHFLIPGSNRERVSKREAHLLNDLRRERVEADRPTARAKKRESYYSPVHGKRAQTGEEGLRMASERASTERATLLSKIVIFRTLGRKVATLARYIRFQDMKLEATERRSEISSLRFRLRCFGNVDVVL